MSQNIQHLNPVDKELIEEKFKNVYLKIETNHNEVRLYLEKILEQVQKTNGRVTTLEKETEPFRIIPKYKKAVGLMLVGLYTVLSSLGIIALFKKMI